MKFLDHIAKTTNHFIKHPKETITKSGKIIKTEFNKDTKKIGRNIDKNVLKPLDKATLKLGNAFEDVAKLSANLEQQVGGLGGDFFKILGSPVVLIIGAGIGILILLR